MIGWGWHTIENQAERPPLCDKYICVILEKIDSRNLFRDAITLRIIDPKSVSDETYITAVPWCDGINFDFTENLCNSWALFFGAGSVEFNEENLPFYVGDRGLRGWGVIGVTDELITTR